MTTHTHTRRNYTETHQSYCNILPNSKRDKLGLTRLTSLCKRNNAYNRDSKYCGLFRLCAIRTVSVTGMDECLPVTVLNPYYHLARQIKVLVRLFSGSMPYNPLDTAFPEPNFTYQKVKQDRWCSTLSLHHALPL